MSSLFRFLHALRSQHTHVDLLAQKVIYDCSGHFVVETLLLFGVDIVFIRVKSAELTKGFFIDVVVYFVADQFLKKVESFDCHVVAVLPLTEQLFNYPLRLALLLDVGVNEAHYVWNHISVLELFRFLQLFGSGAFRTIFIIFLKSFRLAGNPIFLDFKTLRSRGSLFKAKWVE